jgi:hypothetical protein
LYCIVEEWFDRKIRSFYALSHSFYQFLAYEVSWDIPTYEWELSKGSVRGSSLSHHPVPLPEAVLIVLLSTMKRITCVNCSQEPMCSSRMQHAMQPIYQKRHTGLWAEYTDLTGDMYFETANISNSGSMVSIDNSITCRN